MPRLPSKGQPPVLYNHALSSTTRSTMALIHQSSVWYSSRKRRLFESRSSACLSCRSRLVKAKPCATRAFARGERPDAAAAARRRAARSSDAPLPTPPPAAPSTWPAAPPRRPMTPPLAPSLAPAPPAPPRPPDPASTPTASSVCRRSLLLNPSRSSAAIPLACAMVPGHERPSRTCTMHDPSRDPRHGRRCVHDRRARLAPTTDSVFKTSSRLLSTVAAAVAHVGATLGPAPPTPC
mmetsp:Transcript_5448/g.19531  ORF Transcript_5448/g.19531 Transcript_5448/m.19531 type:complete len:237 (-) Transcript_5448:78-788(-)